LVLHEFTHAADPAVAKVIDIIGLTDSFHDVAEIGEASEHIADGHAAEGLIEIGPDDRDDPFALLIVGVDFDDRDFAIGVELLVDFDFFFVGAFFEEFGVFQLLDIALSELIVLGESLTGFVGENFAIGGHEVLGEKPTD